MLVSVEPIREFLKSGVETRKQPLFSLKGNGNCQHAVVTPDSGVVTPNSTRGRDDKQGGK